MIKYGLISEVDARCLEKTIDLIVKELDGSVINITEIGLFNSETSYGVKCYIDSKPGIGCYFTGIDNEKDKPINPPAWMRFIKGNSNEVYNQLEDNSQHLIFVDGCHCFAHVISDFFCYADKVKVGGFLAFHDAGKHIKPFKDFQHGDISDRDAYISVRRALERVGLFKDIGYDMLPGGYVSSRKTGGNGFQLIFDEADEANEAGGICVFQRMK